MYSRYICEVKGKNFNRFLKTLQHLSIQVYKITYQNKAMQIELDQEGYKKVCKLKTTYEIKLISRKGKTKYHFLLRKYRLFLGSLFLGFLLLFFLSHLIWKIEVVHTNKEIRDLLLSSLEEQQVKPFRFKLTYQEKEKVKAKILEQYKDKIEWLEIEEVGTKYYIRVEERKIKQEEQKEIPQHIVASKDAMILSILAEQGEVVAKKFDYVKKGDLLISGIIHKEEEAKSKVKAEGEVFGEVWYTVSVLLPINCIEEKEIGSPKKRFVLHFLNHTLSFQKSAYKTKEKKIIFSSPILPLSFTYETILPIQKIKKHYTLETGEQEGIRLAREKLQVKLKETSQIIDQKVLKKTQKGSRIYIEVFFKVKEDIRAYQSIENINLDLENQKQEETG